MIFIVINLKSGILLLLAKITKIYVPINIILHIKYDSHDKLKLLYVDKMI